MPIFFFFNDTATTEIYTLSLHDALPIFQRQSSGCGLTLPILLTIRYGLKAITKEPPNFHGEKGLFMAVITRSEEHTSELQSRPYLVCRLLLGKKKQKLYIAYNVLLSLST